MYEYCSKSNFEVSILNETSLHVGGIERKKETRRSLKIHTHWVILNSLITITFWAICRSFCENIYVMISVAKTDAFTEGFLSSPCSSLKFGKYGRSFCYVLLHSSWIESSLTYDHTRHINSVRSFH